MKKGRDSCSIFLRNDNGKYLLQLREKGKSDGGLWSLFGGKSEEGETPDETVIREVKEEINFDLKDFEKIDEFVASHGGKRFIYLGAVDKPLNELTLSEGQDFGFFSVEDIEGLEVSDLVKKYIKRLENNEKEEK